MEVDNIIDRLKAQVEELITRHGEMESRVVKSEACVLELRTKNRHLTEQIVKLKDQLKIAELTTGFAGGDSKRARAQLVNLMREIDRCISLVTHE